MADDAGALLVRSGLVSSSALDDARAKVAQGGGTLGEQLVAAGLIPDDALTDFYRSRFLLPQVNPNTLARLPAKVIAAIPVDMAVELRAIPVALDGDNNLTVAMSDPSDRHAVDEIAFFTGTYVVRAVATQMQIAWCLAHYYGHVTPLGERLLQTGNTKRTAPTPAARPRGDTGKVDATRKPALAPGSDAAAAARPRSDELDIPSMPVDPEMDTVRLRPSGTSNPPPRTRSVSGEIRVPVRRAPSIKPAMPEPLEDDDESGPVISIEARSPDEDVTGPRMVPVRRKVKTDPPELAARAGEVELPSGRDRSVDPDGPRIIIDEEALAPPVAPAVVGELKVVAHKDAPVPPASIEVHEGDTAVIRHAAPRDDADDDPDEDSVVELVAPKPKPKPTPRPMSTTQVGIGAVRATTRPQRDTLAEDEAPTRVDSTVAPDAGDFSDETIAPPAPAGETHDEDTSPHVLAAPPRPRKPSDDDDDHDDDDGDGDGLGRHTAVMTAVELDRAIPSRVSPDAVDDGWGPPGTTIPPPLLGAIPGTDEGDGAAIPVPSMDSAPLLVAPPSLPESSRSAPVVSPTGAALARALEDATTRVLELIQALERAKDRDGVVSLMMGHLAESHRRAGFFVIRHGSARLGPNRVNELATFAIVSSSHAGSVPSTLPTASLRLDRPSTFQDVVGTRLPYRGPMHDDASRSFLTSVLGACPPELLLVPVAVRERVVGVLFGEHRLRHTFDDQLALAARAAGLALERTLKKR